MDVLAAKSFVSIYRLPAGGFAVLTVSSDRGNRVLRKALGAATLMRRSMYLAQATRLSGGASAASGGSSSRKP